MIASSILGLAVVLWLVVLGYASYNGWLVWLAWRLRDHTRPRPLAPAELPRVTIQLPVYNEATVVVRLLEAVGRIDYPRARLDVQLLDDSTDETPELAAPIVARLCAEGLDVTHVRRPRRDGFKAGALSAALAEAKGELVLILDADFVPQPSLLHELVPWFSEPRVAMVQSRWGRLSEPRSFIERCAACWIDRHFDIEQLARSRSEQFFHFNGSGGLWRRAAIDDAGGWAPDTLAEDLDLSYRAWRRRWDFVYDPAVVVPAEIPADAASVRVQQARWARGAVQVAKKTLSNMAGVPWARRLQVGLHLTGYAFPVTALSLSLLAGPIAWARAEAPALAVLADGPALAFFAALLIQVIYRAGTQGVRAGWLEAEAAALGIALAPLVVRATLAGLGPTTGTFHRTPKSTPSSPDVGAMVALEALLGLVAIVNVVVAAAHGAWTLVPLPLLAGVGLLSFAARSARPAATAMVAP